MFKIEQAMFALTAKEFLNPRVTQLKVVAAEFD
jgi:hypothetical protein